MSSADSHGRLARSGARPPAKRASIERASEQQSGESLGRLCRPQTAVVTRPNARAGVNRAAVFSKNPSLLSALGRESSGEASLSFVCRRRDYVSASAVEEGANSRQTGLGLLFGAPLAASALGHANSSQASLGFLCSDSSLCRRLVPLPLPLHFPPPDFLPLPRFFFYWLPLEFVPQVSGSTRTGPGAATLRRPDRTSPPGGVCWPMYSV